MSIHGFILGVALLAVVGWCMVQESIRQTQARYKLAELTQRENELRKKLDILRTEEEAVRSPAHLAKIIREKKLVLVALGSAAPAAPSQNSEPDKSYRKPGEVLDAEFSRREPPVRVARSY